MSRKLGALQREILDTLEEAAAFAMTREGRYRGNDYWYQLPEGHRLRQRGAVLPQAPKCALRQTFTTCERQSYSWRAAAAKWTATNG